MSRVPASVLRRALVPIVLACAGLGARADVLDERAQDAIDALRRGDVAAAVAVLDDVDTAAALGARPDLVHVICDRAYRCDEQCAAAPAADRMVLAESLLVLAEAAHEAAPDDVRAHWALAHALVLRERTGMRQGAPAWLRAADLLESAHAQAPADGETLGYAVTFLMEGAVLEPDDQYALLKRAAGIARDAMKAHPATLSLATTIASAEVWGAREMLATSRKSAKSALQVAFETLGPFVRGDLPNRDAAALWNEGVTLDESGRLALHETYVTVPDTALAGAVVFDVPVSPRWTVTHVPETEDSAAYVYVTQTDAAGAPLRQILFRSYTWGLDYTFDGPNDVAGDNVKSIARGLQAVSATNVFAPGPRLSSVKKDHVGRDLTGHSFTVSGRVAGDDGGPLTLYGYCVRGGRQQSFGFLVYVYDASGELGAEMEAVLASLREASS